MIFDKSFFGPPEYLVGPGSQESNRMAVHICIRMNTGEFHIWSFNVFFLFLCSGILFYQVGKFYRGPYIRCKPHDFSHNGSYKFGILI